MAAAKKQWVVGSVDGGKVTVEADHFTQTEDQNGQRLVTFYGTATETTPVAMFVAPTSVAPVG